ncbi:hypothetical protein QQP08_004598, partial [Theobroma cacao]
GERGVGWLPASLCLLPGPLSQSLYYTAKNPLPIFCLNSLTQNHATIFEISAVFLPVKKKPIICLFPFKNKLFQLNKRPPFSFFKVFLEGTSSPYMEYGSGGGSGSGGDHDASDPSRRKKRYHRHTAHQIQRLEA